MTLDICLCPCMSLQRGVKILSILDAVFSVISLILYILGLVALLATTSEELEVTEGEKNLATSIVILAIVLAILQIILALRLYYGSKNRDTRQCRIWLIATVVITAIMVISLIANLSGGKFDGTSGTASLIDLAYKIYEMLVVSSFIKQLGQEMPHVILG